MMKKPPLVIFDIDGTVADTSKRVHHIQGTEKDWDSFYSECDKDASINGMLTLYHMVRKYALVGFLTGRPEKYRTKTREWLINHGFDDYEFLFMRPNDYNRPDWYMKKRVYVTHIQPKYNVIFVVEDRTQVVKMWREMGITCLQCADGDF